jgi:hypothetical protein
VDRLAPLLRGWAGWFIAAMMYVALASISQSWMLWATLTAAAVCSARGVYECVKHPSGRPPTDATPREDPDVEQLIIYGAVAVTVIVSVVLGFRLFFLLPEIQR